MGHVQEAEPREGHIDPTLPSEHNDHQYHTSRPADDHSAHREGAKAPDDHRANPMDTMRQLLMDKVGMAPPFPCNSGHMITIPEHAMPHGTPNTKPRHSMITKTQRP